MRIALTSLAVAGIAAGLSCAATVPANAYTGTPISTLGPTGMCSDICLYYNSPSLGYGAIFTADGDIDDLAGYKFSANPGATRYGGNPNAGAGQYVKNNAAAAEDEAFYCVLDIYYNSKAYGYGNYDFLGVGYTGRLETTYNQDAAIGLSNCSS
jgi:hypothetical protein